MKNKRLLRLFYILYISILAINNSLSASPVDSTMARKAATHFYNWRMGRSVSPEQAQLTYVEQIPSQQSAGGLQTEQVNAFYVFDFGGQFVMVSADTRVLPILAYSTETGFSGDDVPETLGWFLDMYTQQIAYAIQHLSDADCEENVNAWNQWLSNEMPVMATAATVGPLVQTSWSQSYPYNAQCPEDPSGSGGHVVTGCVATAMAQIIRYWQYPTQGIGSHSYSGDYGVQSVDFSAATYDYSLMPLSLSPSSPEAQINEVAKLMYHCGVSVDMIYGTNGSGASTHNAAYALNTYFGYSGVIEKYRSSYTDENWIALLKGELNNLRPILYSGSGTGGHAFVCDGYDNSNSFHFNWGWGGYYDGYYTLSSLTPGGNNFSSGQQAVIGIDASQPLIQAGVSSMTFLTEAGTISASQSTPILTAHLSSGITATVTGNFKISTDNTNFYTSLTLGSTGGTLYVRHEPTSTSGTEYGFVTLVSGSVQETFYLKGILFDNTPHCLPPENLNVSSQDLHSISLHWDAPVIDPDPHTLSWSSQTYTTNLGIGNNYKVSLLQRFSSEDLVPYHNQALTSITFYARSGISTFKAVVYQGGSYNGGYDAGTQVLSQNIPLSSLTMNAWNTVTLNTPVMVDATQELWFGIYVESASTSLPVSNQEIMPTKGCIMGTHNAESVSWSELSQTYSFCLLGTVKNAQAITNYTISRDGSTLATTSSTNYTDHVTGTNTYHYTVTANWSNGCSASAQRSITNVMSISASPKILSFYSNHGHGTLVKTVAVGGIGLSSAINISVTGNFLVSTNGTAFATSATLPKTGGILYVKYAPTSNNSEYETGLMTLTSGNSNATVSLAGQSCDECNPPQNLVISQSGNTVGLSWNAPAAQVITQQPLTWYENTDFIGFGSANSSIQRYIVHRFDTNDLAPYHGKRLTAVSFIASPDVTTYRIVVYQGGKIRTATYLQSGTQVVNQNVDISSLTMGYWNTIPLNTPVTIDASQELWYGIYLESPAGTYPIYVGSPYVKKGLISKTATDSDNDWVEYLANSYYHNTYCFVLNATVEDAPLSLTNYQIDRNVTTVGTTGNTFYDDSITYNGTYNYDVWAVWSNGCKAPIRGSITVSGLCDPAGQTYTQEACESYTWYGTPYNTSGTYHHTYLDGGGCPVLDTLVLTIHTGTHNVETKSACESYTWHGTTYTSSGIYQYYYDNAYGCASVDTLHLTINHGTHNVETHTACESYTWHGHTYTTSGTYTYPYTNGLGCPSTDTLHLTVNYGTHNVETHTACESYIWHGQTYTSSGTYTHPYTNANGCASVDTLHLIVNHGTHNVETETACESYTWHGTTYTTSGTYTYAYNNTHGCASVDTLKLTVHYGTHNVVTETSCESFTWHGTTYTTSGTYTYAYNNSHGCASVDNLMGNIAMSNKLTGHVGITAHRQVACYRTVLHRPVDSLQISVLRMIE
ncbi:MAG: C10 family peptidase, partial [Bacteroidales bacterium]|nr:C10 family peptidase [Bacteroidales bacterium]